MNRFVFKMLSAVVAVAGLAAANSAHAVWTFTGATTANSVVTVSNTNSNSALPNLTTTTGAYVTNNATTGAVSGNWVSSSASTSASALQFYSGGGLGMCSDPDASNGTSCNSPNHALDNAKNTEAVLVGFSSSVVLSSIGLGYVNNGSTSTGITVDLSVFRWVGSAATPTLNGLSATSMTGWELVGNYGEMTATGNNAINTAGSGSSWWLISAYNSGFSGSKENVGGLDNGNDYFKLLSLTGTSCTSNTNGVCNAPRAGVPEPASLALVGVALLGVYGTRRRRQAATA